MKNKLALAFLLVIVAVVTAGPGEYIKRVADSKLATAETGSYTYIKNVNVSSASWTVPDSIIILAICVDSAGTVTVSTKESDSVQLFKPGDFCYNVRVTKIFKIGTDSLLRNGKIEVFGFKRN